MSETKSHWAGSHGGPVCRYCGVLVGFGQSYLCSQDECREKYKEERTVIALESIAESLMKIANPLYKLAPIEPGKVSVGSNGCGCRFFVSTETDIIATCGPGLLCDGCFTAANAPPHPEGSVGWMKVNGPPSEPIEPVADDVDSIFETVGSIMRGETSV